ncbi:TPA: hypothetical protein OCP62_004339 [Escherichia coli]|nr:hypothetical protein [Escherichia coli]
MVVRYDLTEDFAGAVDITPVPDSHEGRYVRYEDYKELDDSFQDYITATDMEIEGLVSRLAEVNAELQKYKDQFPDYVECANCGSVTHVEGVD